MLEEWKGRFLQSGGLVLSFALSRRDRDGGAFRQNLVVAARRAGWRGDRWPDVADTAFVCAFYDDLVRQADGPVFLMLDDAHHAPEPFLRDMAELAPDQVHLIVASRERLSLPLARLRTLEQLVELGPEDLRLDAEECGRLYRLAADGQLAGREWAQLVEKAEGWPVGLKVALRDLPSGKGSRLSGRHVDLAAYFEEEVLNRLSAQERRFLTTIAILPRLSGELCRYVSADEQAEQMLYKLHSDGVFLSAMDAEHRWMRLHGLLAEHLRSRIASLGQSEKVLHLRACDWFEARGMTQDAFDHAHAAGDMQRAGAILLAGYRDLFASWRYTQFLEMAERLPRAVVEQLPELAVAMAWPLSVRRQWAHAGALIEGARKSLAALAGKEGTASPGYRQLSFAIAHSEMVRTKYCGHNYMAERQCRELIDGYPDGDPFTLGVVYTSLMLVRCANYHLKGVEETNSQALEQYRVAGITGPNAFHVKTYAHYLGMVGRTDEALEVLSQALEEGIARGYGKRFGSLIAIPLAALRYRCGQVREADSLLSHYREEAEHSNLIDVSTQYWVTRASIAWHKGDRAHAHYILGKAWFCAEAQGSDRFKATIACERIRLLLASGQPDVAGQVGSDLGLPDDSKSLMPESDGAQVNGLRAMAWASLALAQGRLPDAIRVASAWSTFTMRAMAVADSIGWQLLLSRAQWLSGDHRAAQRSIRSTLADAAQAGLLQTVLDEGPIVGRLVAEECRRNRGEEGREQSFRAALMAEISRLMGDRLATDKQSEIPDGRICEALTRKELEILSMIGSGKRNVDVAGKVGISEGSVKWYLQRIYDKMGVRKRSIAVERARQLGWMH
ncbi:LuxR C-terminal-related transcriptional regulator [Aurantiacibacter xanthus]|uniref:LuxR C-terminal-related transcriptional regulator n=1 Tax=Aurantiacibacter xanthus TaxID=1784712 RepID=UPI00174CFAAB|nr:LuxR C-terminal-related transcriptional regulator [Aurantiacibacter xanthus]